MSSWDYVLDPLTTVKPTVDLELTCVCVLNFQICTPLGKSILVTPPIWTFLFILQYCLALKPGLVPQIKWCSYFLFMILHECLRHLELRRWFWFAFDIDICLVMIASMSCGVRIELDSVALMCCFFFNYLLYHLRPTNWFLHSCQVLMSMIMIYVLLKTTGKVR